MKKITYVLVISLLLSSSCIFAQIPELDWPIETVSEGHGFTEGPVLAPDGRVLFSDMNNNLILSFNPASGTTSVWQNESRRSNGLFIHDNHLYACETLTRSLVRYDLTIGPDSREVLVREFQEDTLQSPNDLTIIGDDLFFSDLRGGRVYKLSLNGHSMDTVAYNFKNPNGIFGSPDGKQLYIADFGIDKLYKAEIIEGQIGPVQLITDLSTFGFSGPDGLAVSNDGYIMQAFYRSEKVAVIAPDGSVIGFLSTGPLSSNCILAENGRVLYITADKKLKRVIIPQTLLNER